MPRNRMIKPEFWSSDSLSRISFESNLLFIGLWNFCDDYGVYLLSLRKILGDIFPLRPEVTEQEISKWLNELLEIKVVKCVKHLNKQYLIVSNWSEHQRVPNPNKRRWLEEDIQSSLDPNESLIRVSLDTKSPKGKGKGKGKGKDAPLNPKKRYGEYQNLLLSDDELCKLKEKFGENGSEHWCRTLDEYIEQMGAQKKYKSHYLTILKWEKDEKGSRQKKGGTIQSRQTRWSV